MRKAAGTDGWLVSHWAVLPVQFFEKLAVVWNMVLDGASIPASWLQVRICTIPKPTGGDRPLAIAALAWRLGATVIARELWVARVFPAELYGGMPGRSTLNACDKP